MDYIDWTLSMGLFLVVVVSLFVFLQPGMRPEHEGEGLMTIVEEQLFAATDSALKEKPLYIKKLKDKYGTNQEATIKVSLTGSSWKIHKVEPSSLSSFEPLSITSQRVVFNCKVGQCTQDFVIYLKPTHANPSEPLVSLTCTPKDPTICDATLGVVETIKGLDQGLLTQLGTKNYTALKTQWRFPSQQHFAIYINDNKLIGGVEPTQQQNVFVKQKTYWQLSGLSRVPLTLNMRVW